ncbi:MAG: hypothetical protein ABL996_20405 [Micropepsaceae bacterium]
MKKKPVGAAGVDAAANAELTGPIENTSPAATAGSTVERRGRVINGFIIVMSPKA